LTLLGVGLSIARHTAPCTSQLSISCVWWPGIFSFRR